VFIEAYKTKALNTENGFYKVFLWYLRNPKKPYLLVSEGWFGAPLLTKEFKCANNAGGGFGLLLFAPMAEWIRQQPSKL
tara:strand:+ start:2321 stop:2557 length:237 start_codon:yes stop_codon:yes gene_type:complete